MAKDPSFPFYSSDWLGSSKVALMSLEEQGAYVRLLCHAWGDSACSLPADDESLAALSTLGKRWSRTAARLRPCFTEHPTLPGRLCNPRLLALWEERRAWIEKSAAGGRKSARVRWGGDEPPEPRGNHPSNHPHNHPVTNRVATPQPSGNSPSPSPSSDLSNNRSVVPCRAQGNETIVETEEREEETVAQAMLLRQRLADLATAAQETDHDPHWHLVAQTLTDGEVFDCIRELERAVLEGESIESRGKLLTDICKRRAALRGKTIFAKHQRSETA